MNQGIHKVKSSHCEPNCVSLFNKILTTKERSVSKTFSLKNTLKENEAALPRPAFVSGCMKWGRKIWQTILFSPHMHSDNTSN